MPDVKAVQRLMGMVTYLTKFCLHLSDQCTVLGDLTHKDSKWNWTTEPENTLMKLIANATVLKYYNPDKKLTVMLQIQV